MVSTALTALANHALVLRKTGFDPNQPRDSHGMWTNDPGAGKAFPYGPGKGEQEAIKGRDWAQADLAHLMDTKGVNHPDTIAAAASVKTQEANVERIRTQRIAEFERKHPPRTQQEGPKPGPSNRFSYTEWQRKQQEARQAAPTPQDPALDLHDVPPGELRAKAAAISERAASLVRTANNLLSTIGAFNTSGEPNTINRLAAATAGVAALAIAVNTASRAKNGPTLVTAINTARRGVRTLRQEMPHLVDTAATINRENAKSKLNTAVNSVTTNLRRLDQAIQQTETGRAVTQAAARTAFRATGGRIIPAGPDRSPITTVYWRR